MPVKRAFAEMRALYLVCPGQSDGASLSDEGRIQAEALGRYLRCIPAVQVLTGPFPCCQETAATAGFPVQTIDGLFAADREQQAGNLVYDAFQTVWDMPQTGPLALIVPSSTIWTLCSALLEKPSEDALVLPYGSVTQLLLNDGIAYPGPVCALPDALPLPVPNEETCLALLKTYGTPEPVVNHCRAVAETALELWARLDSQGVLLDRELIYAGALLHDIARTAPHHAREGACWLTAQGYAAVAAVVGEHMDLPPAHGDQWTGAGVVFLADKLVRETARVTLEQRFFDHITPEKAPYVQARYHRAKTLWDRLHGN